MLRPKLGFGLYDLIDVALRHSDEVLAHLEDHRPHEGPSDDEEPWFHGAGFVSQAEVNAIITAPTLAQTIERCTDAESAARAVRWATTTVERLHCEPSMSNGLFGAARLPRSIRQPHKSKLS